jgi:hypothetical protein
MTDGTKWRCTEGLQAYSLGAHGVVATTPIYHLPMRFLNVVWYTLQVCTKIINSQSVLLTVMSALLYSFLYYSKIHVWKIVTFDQGARYCKFTIICYSATDTKSKLHFSWLGFNLISVFMLFIPSRCKILEPPVVYNRDELPFCSTCHFREYIAYHEPV